MTHRTLSPAEAPDPEKFGPAGEQPRSTADDWSEESCRQARVQVSTSGSEQRIFAEFRRKVAAGETISRALEKLAEALRFSGRITITFHQGKLTKTVLEESYYRSRMGM